MINRLSETSDTHLRRAAEHWSRVRHSVFAKLLATMIAMALSILAVVVAFFWFTVGPNLHLSVSPVLDSYTRDLAERSLDFATAKRLHEQINLEVRHEGPEGTWTTADDMPTVADVREGRVQARSAVMLRRNYHIVPGPKNATYLFAWSLGQRMNEAHTIMLVLMITVITTVVLATYFVLKRFLEPVRTLNEGVENLAAGRLDVTVKVGTRDEFGRLTEAFNHMVGRVKAMIGARDQLLADVSHELRSPLTRMRVAIELLPLGTDRKGMEEDLAEMERKVTELLELERLRSGRGLELATHDLLDVIKRSADEFRDRPPGVRVTGTSEALPMEIDAEKVHSVFRNLLDNAFKYGSSRQPVDIWVVDSPEAVVVRVSDGGPGIADADTLRIFEPFYRTDPSRSRNTGGYGLGLSICKRVMQAHGGDIILDHNRNQGATFVLTFPK